MTCRSQTKNDHAAQSALPIISSTKTACWRAHTLLRDPSARDLGTAEIGFAAGFGEVSTFYRRFKQRYGMTPGEWRAS